MTISLTSASMRPEK